MLSAKLVTDRDKKAYRSTKWPAEFQEKVNLNKINLPVIKKWTTDELTRILGDEDDIVTSLVFNMLEGSDSPDVKKLQISLSGFLDKDAPSFCLELWKLCLSAQDNPNGIPKQLLEAKKQELINEKLEEDRAREEALKRQLADRERDSRGGRDRVGNGRSARNSDRHPPPRRDYHSDRSPRRRREGDSDNRDRPSSRRIGDTYVPSRQRRHSPLAERPRSPPPRRRRRSPSSSPSSSRSRSRSRLRSHSRERRRPSPQRKRRERSNSRSRRSYDRHVGGRLSRSPPTGKSSTRRRSHSPRRRNRRRRSSSSLSPSRSPPQKRIRPSQHSPSSTPPSRELIAERDVPRDQHRLSRQSSTKPPADASDIGGKTNGAHGEKRVDAAGTDIASNERVTTPPEEE